MTLLRLSLLLQVSLKTVKAAKKAANFPVRKFALRA